MVEKDCPLASSGDPSTQISGHVLRHVLIRQLNSLSCVGAKGQVQPQTREYLSLSLSLYIYIYIYIYKDHNYNSVPPPIVQELCESRGGRPGLSVLTNLLVSVDLKKY